MSNRTGPLRRALAIALLLTGSPVPSVGASRIAAVILDDATGRAVYSVDADEARHPASLVKLMTLYELFLELESGRLKPSARIEVSAKAARQPPSSLGLEAGQTLSVQQAIRALTLKSANDVAVAVAETVSGSERAFVRRMNESARFLGLRGTVFRNASGLYARGQKTTARDMARLARKLRHRFPQFYHHFSERWFRVNGKGHGNHNSFLNRYPDADGLKTGFISASGYNLAASAKRGAVRLFGVVLGAASARARDREMERLFERAFRKLGAPRARQPARRSRLPGAPVVRSVPANAPAAAAKAAGTTWSVALGEFDSFDGASAHAASVRRRLLQDHSATVAVKVPTAEGKTRFVAYLNGLDRSEAETVCDARIAKSLPCEAVLHGAN